MGWAQQLLRVFALSRICTCALGLKFDLEASHNPVEKCIWDYALVDQLVLVTINAVATTGSAWQSLDVQIVDGSHHNNVYWSQKDIRAETRMAINSHADADLGVCFINRLSKSTSPACISRLIPPVCNVGKGMPLTHRMLGVMKPHKAPYMTSIDVDIDIGAEAIDYNAIANQESLSGLETELRRLTNEAQEIEAEMVYLKRREQKMRDTNESTNYRVHVFAWLTVFGLITVGTWQIFHLRNFFRTKYLID